MIWQLIKATRIPPLEKIGIFRGREGARELAQLLEEELPEAP